LNGPLALEFLDDLPVLFCAFFRPVATGLSADTFDIAVGTFCFTYEPLDSMSQIEHVKQKSGKEQIRDEDGYGGHNECHNRSAAHRRCPAFDT
jgi:hypothetical protein